MIAQPDTTRPYAPPARKWLLLSLGFNLIFAVAVGALLVIGVLAGSRELCVSRVVPRGKLSGTNLAEVRIEFDRPLARDSVAADMVASLAYSALLN